MIIGQGIDGASRYLILGLSRQNVRRLIAGEPIRISKASHGTAVPEGWTIAIVFGETELEIGSALRKDGVIDESTEIKVDPRLGS
jgi:hypothetical protein